MPSFVTVKDASRLTGKSPSSIRRIIYRIIADDAHADREHIKPSVDEVKKLRVEGENFAWKLSEELLRREVPIEAATEKISDDRSTSPPHAESELVALLRRELEIKNQQITQQHELFARHLEMMNGLNERLKEGNFLIASLQHRLTLPEGRPATTPEPPKTKRGASAQAEKGSSIVSKPPKPKKSFLSRIFG